MFRLLRLPACKWLMLLEAACYLIVARSAVLLVPFTRIGLHLGTLQPPAQQALSATAMEVQTAKDVRWAVNAVANRFPVDMVCLPRALAGWRMLQSRGIPSRLHFGAPLRPEPNRTGLQTHAWLSSSGVEVTGFPVAYGCVEVGFFSRTASRAAIQEGTPVAGR